MKNERFQNKIDNHYPRKEILNHKIEINKVISDLNGNGIKDIKYLSSSKYILIYENNNIEVEVSVENKKIIIEKEITRNSRITRAKYIDNVYII